MTSSANGDLTNKILGAHSFSGDETTLEMEIDGVRYYITGRATGVLPIGGPEIIELLHVNATLECQALSAEAPGKFHNAIRRLVGERQEPFYTVLKDSWTTHAVRWGSATRI